MYTGRCGWLWSNIFLSFTPFMNALSGTILHVAHMHSLTRASVLSQVLMNDIYRHQRLSPRETVRATLPFPSFFSQNENLFRAFYKERCTVTRCTIKNTSNLYQTGWCSYYITFWYPCTGRQVYRYTGIIGLW